MDTGARKVRLKRQMNKKEYKKTPETVPYEEYLRVRQMAQRMREEKKRLLYAIDSLNEEIEQLKEVIENAKERN